MATASTTISDLAEVKVYLKAQTTGDDTTITEIADGVSARIESMTGRAIVNRTNPVWTFDAKGGNRIFIRTYPVDSITLLRTRPNMKSSFSTVASTAYELDGERGVVYLNGSAATDSAFPRGPRLTELTYVAGFGAQGAASLPQDLVLAYLDWCKFAYSRFNAGMNLLQQVSIGPFSASSIPDAPKDVLRTIMSYRRLRF